MGTLLSTPTQQMRSFGSRHLTFRTFRMSRSVLLATRVPDAPETCISGCSHDSKQMSELTFGELLSCCRIADHAGEESALVEGEPSLVGEEAKGSIELRCGER